MYLIVFNIPHILIYEIQRTLTGKTVTSLTALSVYYREYFVDQFINKLLNDLNILCSLGNLDQLKYHTLSSLVSWSCVISECAMQFICYLDKSYLLVRVNCWNSVVSMLYISSRLFLGTIFRFWKLLCTNNNATNDNSECERWSTSTEHDNDTIAKKLYNCLWFHCNTF